MKSGVISNDESRLFLEGTQTDLDNQIKELREEQGKVSQNQQN
jgi:hypothetical protein